MHLARGRLDEALRHADVAIQVDKHRASAWSLRGDVLRQQGDLEGALGSYFRALSAGGDQPNVRLAIAEIFHQQHRHRRTLAILQGVDESPSGGGERQRARFLKGLALASLNRPEDAVQALAAACEVGPPTAALLYHLAESQLATGRLSEAQQSATQAMHLAEAGQHPAIGELRTRINSRRQHRMSGVWR
jgi:tetratricopeptide (TPR) repeat protein